MAEVSTRSSDVPADEPQRPVPDERAGQQPRLAQDLEPVADAEHRTAALGEGAHLVHDGGEPRDRARAQVVAVGEPARQDDRVDAAQVVLGVPQGDALAAHRVDGPQRVPVVERPRERDDADARTSRSRRRPPRP